MGIYFIDHFVNIISDTLDTSTSQINLVVCMLLSYLFGYVNRFINDPTKRLIFGLISGIFLQFQMYGPGIIHIFAATLNTYLFIKFFGRKLSSFYILFFNIIHLLYLHFDMMMNSFGNWSLGVEVIYMLSICKFSSIAFNYEDGEKDEKELKSKFYRENAIKEKPTLLETFSYVFYYATAVIGPSIEFKDYQRFIYKQREYKNIPYDMCNKSARNNLLLAFACATLLVKFADSSDPKYVATEEFANKNLLYKIGYVYFSVLVLRSRYYTGWKLCQGSMDFCGISYTEKTNADGKIESSFDKIDVCNLMVMEFSINPRTKIQYWNRSVHLWLKYHIYIRMINTKMFEKKKGLASFITFAISALWHGFYLSYYLFFFHLHLIEQVTSYLEEKYDLFNKIDKSNFLVKFLAWNAVMLNLIYFGNTFSLLSTTLIYNYYRSFYFAPNILFIFAFVYCKFFAKKIRKTEKKFVENIKSIN